MEPITRVIGGREFWRVGELVIRRDASGRMVEYTHDLAASVRTNPFAAGPFCRLALPAAPSAEGVYAIDVNGTIVYLGECISLSQRFGATGYGAISPRNCHHDGQSTNCKLNSRILAVAKEAAVAVVWFHPSDDRHRLEAALIAELRPMWNGRAERVEQPASAPRRAKHLPISRVGARPTGHANAFRATLIELLRNAQHAGLTSLQVRSGDLHRAVGDYPGPNHRMPVCCSAMRGVMTAGDRIVQQPPKGNGANFVVEYLLPRTR